MTTPRSHIVLWPEIAKRCDSCEHGASRFILCRRCRKVVATCQNHNRSIEEERERHCPPSPPKDPIS